MMKLKKVEELQEKAKRYQEMFQKTSHVMHLVRWNETKQEVANYRENKNKGNKVETEIKETINFFRELIKQNFQGYEKSGNVIYLDFCIKHTKTLIDLEKSIKSS